MCGNHSLLPDLLRRNQVNPSGLNTLNTTEKDGHGKQKSTARDPNPGRRHPYEITSSVFNGSAAPAWTTAQRRALADALRTNKQLEKQVASLWRRFLHTGKNKRLHPRLVVQTIPGNERYVGTLLPGVAAVDDERPAAGDL